MEELLISRPKAQVMVTMAFVRRQPNREVNNMRSGKIYLIGNDETLHPLEEQAYLNEDILQVLLAKYPDLLAGDQIDETTPRRWLLVSREFGVPGEEEGGERWSLDHLFLDQDGIPTLVEVKRSTDTRIRREVVGQMLDYAANAVVYWPIEKIRSTFESACQEQNVDPDQVIRDLLEEESLDNAVVEAFWERVKTNLQAKRIRMVFVADEIPPELRRVVEFLNEQMNPAEMIAVEVRQFVGEGVKTLVPRLVGQTAAAQRAKSSGSREKRQWDYDSFMSELETRQGLEVVSVARSLHDWIKPKVTYIYWGQGATMGSLIPVLRIGNDKYFTFSAWTYGNLEIQFQPLKTRPPFDEESKRLDLLGRLNEINGVDIPRDAIARRPSFPMALLANAESFDQFRKCIEWVLGEIEKHTRTQPA